MPKNTVAYWSTIDPNGVMFDEQRCLKHENTYRCHINYNCIFITKHEITPDRRTHESGLIFDKVSYCRTGERVVKNFSLVDSVIRVAISFIL